MYILEGKNIFYTYFFKIHAYVLSKVVVINISA